MLAYESSVEYCAACGNPTRLNEVEHKEHGQGQLICVTESQNAVVYFYEQKRNRNVALKELKMF
ncbi:hypothetical protein [Paenibacillus agricola]|uniref:Uncharacterized protein n=1 Tax=Paenibacillus agricola TaxID=2716264 RepID=A0ABX0J6H3_9BACL|nr:hypothetical protein [Paenibacillus agricola]NHN31218.1 hypothetical protein [Paenibacillus agricola]